MQNDSNFLFEKTGTGLFLIRSHIDFFIKAQEIKEIKMPYNIFVDPYIFFIIKSNQNAVSIENNIHFQNELESFSLRLKNNNVLRQSQPISFPMDGAVFFEKGDILATAAAVQTCPAMSMRIEPILRNAPRRF